MDVLRPIVTNASDSRIRRSTPRLKSVEADIRETACGVFATDDVAMTRGQEQNCEGH